MKKIKVFAISSKGGHWSQLMQMKTLLERFDVTYGSTDATVFEKWDIKNKLVLDDFNRASLWRAFSVAKKIFAFLLKEKPKYVISTGAAPGLLAILIARLLRIKTIWIDSIANADKLSMSGRVASYVSDYTLTQWKHLESSKVVYRGRLVGG